MSRIYEETGVAATLRPGGSLDDLLSSTVHVMPSVVSSIGSPFQVSSCPSFNIKIGDVLEFDGAKHVVGDAGAQRHFEQFEATLTVYPANFFGSISSIETTRNPGTMRPEAQTTIVVAEAIGFIAAMDFLFHASDGGRREHSVGDAVFPAYVGIENGHTLPWPSGEISEVQDLDILSFPGSARFRVVKSSR